MQRSDVRSPFARRSFLSRLGGGLVAAGIHPSPVPLADSVIYETHVKGFTKLNEHIREEIQSDHDSAA